MPTRPTRKIATPRTILRVTELERRDTPAWWAVATPSVPEGTPGSTDATITGSLTLNPDYPVTNGRVTVWADSPVQAATMALTGTMHTVIADRARGHDFVTDNVSDDPLDHRSFLVVVNAGGGIDILFEDMAGDPDADYDYNDRQWGDLSVGGTGNPIDTEDTWTWANQVTNESVTVHLKVTEPSPDKMLWHYDVTNNGFSTSSPEFRGVGAFGVNLGDPAAVSKQASGQADWVVRGPAVWNTPDTKFGSVVVMGATGWFEFTTPPRSIVPATGFVAMASQWGFGQGATGPLKAPGTNDFKADITIDGDLTVGAANPEIPGSKSVVTQFSPKNDTNEDTIGGLVVRKADINNVDDNKAPRQQITIQKLKDAAGNPAVGGQVTLTVPGQVKLFDVATKGSSVATGTVFDQTALPKKLWVEGAVGSTTMRDAKIKATPVGNPAGADDVSFTVLWVDVVVATSKYISDNNDKRDNYIAATELGTGKLGLQKYSVGPRMGWGTEARGAVSPANFDYPGGDLHLGRDVEYYIYNDTKELDKPDHFSQVIPAGNDTSKPWIRDDNPVDSGGFIYDYDALGLVMNEQVNGFIKRVRSNIRAFAAITIDSIPVRPSGIYAYSIRFSMKQTGPNPGNDWSIISPADVPGDNAVLVGPETTKTTWNLQ